MLFSRDGDLLAFLFWSDLTMLMSSMESRSTSSAMSVDQSTLLTDLTDEAAPKMSPTASLTAEAAFDSLFITLVSDCFTFSGEFGSEKVGGFTFLIGLGVFGADFDLVEFFSKSLAKFRTLCVVGIRICLG